MLKIAWSDCYCHPLPANHRFPMEKYELLPEQLLYEGTISTSNFFDPGLPTEAMVLRTHESAYWEKLRDQKLSRSEIRRTGFPLSRQLVDREMTIVHGTTLCARYALTHGVSMNIAGGTHHAFTNRGEGFCLLNDMAVAAHFLLDQQLAGKILIVDLDVHQGNGTAQIFRNDARVFTFSMHGARNYPMQKEISDLDIGLPDGADDHFYLKILEVNLKNLLHEVEPDFIFFQSGVDILATDKLGRLAISRDGCRQRDKMVLQLSKENNIPLVASMGGGYSTNIKDIVEAHANTFRLAQEIYF
ncbi:Deacetylase [Fulvivirga imtechensis AK7]|uniref:Deacetylase n=1 Tax=Fulvivirga imtechensis AK7 TaxID=1237149 RepID=L8JXW6_9BACT|nr:histone deacetylase [Fulvivirga imtechensis]ELR73901.1 Deacetylase [Fulvivirga imtechensis AK7]